MKKQTLKQLVRYCTPYKLSIFFMIFFASTSVACSLYVPVLIGQGVDTMISQNNTNFVQLIQVLQVFALVVVGQAVFQLLLNYVTNKIAYQITNDLRNETYQKLHTIPLKSVDELKQGQVVSRIIGDIELITTGVLQAFTSLFTGLATIIGTIIMMCMIEFSIARIVILLTPVSLIVASIIAKRTHQTFKEQLQIRGQLTSYVEEIIGNHPTVAMNNYQQTSAIEFEEMNTKMHKNGVLSQFYGALINPTTRLVNSFVYSAVGIYGAICAMNGLVSIGMLSSFLAYANQYTKPFNEISSVIGEMQTALAASARVFDFLALKDDQDQRHKSDFQATKGHIVFDHVCFSYGTKPFIEDLCIDVAPGSTVAIVGKTGCGKTTLINLLMRFFEFNSGTIYIDGVNVLDVKKQDVRSSFGMILQNSWIFKGTVRQNITYGFDQVSQEQLEQATKKARIHKFIMSLPQGYDTILEENGNNLSLGQKQLLCIARMMVNNPPMLILDEATSSIDTRTEIQVQQAFDEMMQGKTTFIVAHRLSTIQNADKILVMDNGKLIEQGNHYELLEKNGFYKELYTSQFEQ